MIGISVVLTFYLSNRVVNATKLHSFNQRCLIIVMHNLWPHWRIICRPIGSVCARVVANLKYFSTPADLLRRFFSHRHRWVDVMVRWKNVFEFWLPNMGNKFKRRKISRSFFLYWKEAIESVGHKQVWLSCEKVTCTSPSPAKQKTINIRFRSRDTQVHWPHVDIPFQLLETRIDARSEGRHEPHEKKRGF